MSDARPAAPNPLPEPDRERWSPLRAGIQNVWEYDDRRFVFHRGRLLLRGRNEAGKTKAVELLFPFLLDADLSPQRLDPFGSTSRPMRWNLINEATPNAQLRVGYVWLELGRRQGGAAEFLTIGAGLKARRSAPDIDSWFFVTSRRPDRDLALFAADGRPLSRADLEEALGDSGQVFQRQADYRRALNERLFGFPDDQYAALVDTLLHLRQPQLSKALNLDQLSTFLSASLPPLEPRVIAPIADGFEQLDRHRAELENLARTLATLRSFEVVYAEYARALAKERARELTGAESAYQRARGEAREQEEARDRLGQGLAELEESLAREEARERELLAREKALRSSDAYRAARELDEVQALARAAEERRARAEERRAADARLLTEAGRRLGEAGDELRRAGEALERARGEAFSRAGEAALSALHPPIDALLGQGDDPGAAGVLAACLAERQGAIRRLRELGKELTRAEDAHRAAEDRARERGADVVLARDALHLSERALEAARVRFEKGLELWAESLSVLTLPPGLLDEPPEPAALREAVNRVAEPLRHALASELASCESRAAALRDEQGGLRAEREALAAAPHPTPAPPPWRPARPAERPGAPLYLLCEFGEAARGDEAGIEAALEASGLLDAWVEPEGLLLDPRTGDAILRGAAVAGRTLADVLVPAGGRGVARERALSALRSVGFAAAGEEPEGDCWVSADGRFRLGAVVGAHAKPMAGYVGASAREAERARRIAGLEARIAALGEELGALVRLGAEVAGRQDGLRRELSALPASGEIEHAAAVMQARAEALAGARGRLEEAERTATTAAASTTRALGALEEAAATAGLGAFARDPDAIAERTRAYAATAEQAVSAGRNLARARLASSREETSKREAEARDEGSKADAGRAREEAGAARARADALREAAGADAVAVVSEIEKAAAGAEEARQARTRGGREKAALDQAFGDARRAAEVAAAQVGDRDGERKARAAAFEALRGRSLLAAAGFELEAEVGSFTASLEQARRVDGAISKGGTAEEREKVEDRLLRRQSELQHLLPPDVRILPTHGGGALSYDFSWNSRTGPAREVLEKVEGEVAVRTGLLGDEEGKLIEEFLSGEAHDHLAGRLREARARVERMNDAIRERTTASGTQVQLSWEVDPEHPGAGEAVALFLSAGRLLSEGNRKALRLFMHERLARARDAEDGRSLQERMLEVLDYRPWHRFTVQHRMPGEAWAPLTRKAHAAGSGGKKSVMLHLPLFAAAAAFYDSARPGAPRLVALDEAFAGIDRQTRGQLMGLLAEFDLDFVMTSFEEWGFYEELDGLSTYHLSRDPAVPGVHADWFVWNGREQVRVEDA